MINSIRNTVLSIINKNNYGYISPSDFNLFAKQAQLDLFEDYFYTYNFQINKENARRSGTGYADIKKGLAEVIESFSVSDNLTYIAASNFRAPTAATTGSDYYLINKVLFNNGTKLKEMEKVTHTKITMLNNSLLTAPNETFPAYTLEGDVITAYPTTINAFGQVNCQYFRYPKDPKWTYVVLASGTPVFDSTQPDFQDFELPLSDEPYLVAKILEYAGISIRETEVYQFGKTEETQNIQEESR
tara:strand:- start:2976 stop:3707 length:732 start_codon:yes stop_codon:yes gene_type:complete